jgi:FMN phosphatase YigB (HAD superfamily)
MNKKAFLFFICLFICAGGIYVYSTRTTVPVSVALTNPTPEHVEFAWDMHSVFVQKSVGAMIIATAWYHGGKIITLIVSALCDYIRYLFTGTVGATQQLIHDLWYLKHTHASGTAYFDRLNAYHNGWGNIILTITAQYWPDPDMVSLIQELAHLGYTQRIATNADSMLFLQQYQKYPELFAYLDGGMHVNEHMPWIKKPYAQFYNTYQHHYNGNGHKTIIFVDNSSTNSHAATQAGMLGIHFTNPQRLRTQLIHLGIPLKSG